MEAALSQQGLMNEWKVWAWVLGTFYFWGLWQQGYCCMA
jgi:hypothetical protein